MNVVSVARWNTVKPFENARLVHFGYAHAIVLNIDLPVWLGAVDIGERHCDLRWDLSGVTNRIVQKVAEHAIKVGPVTRDYAPSD